VVQKISLKQKQNLEFNEDIRWAQTHIQQNTYRCSNFTSLSGSGLDGFSCNLTGTGMYVWYWRGDGSGYGSNTTVYYAVNDNLADANSTRQELIGSNFTAGLVNNTNNAAVFNISSGALYVNMTVCSYVNKTIGAGNQAYKSRMVIRTRN
jgi:hypothetical protein